MEDVAVAVAVVVEDVEVVPVVLAAAAVPVAEVVPVVANVKQTVVFI